MLVNGVDKSSSPESTAGDRRTVGVDDSVGSSHFSGSVEGAKGETRSGYEGASEHEQASEG